MQYYGGKLDNSSIDRVKKGYIPGWEKLQDDS